MNEIMQNIMHRDKTGKTILGNGAATIQVPKSELALSIVAHNPIQNGDVFRQDGWVYGLNGEKRRKWFKSIVGLPDTRFWEPKTNDLPLLEAKRWKWYKRAAKRTTPLWEEAAATLRKIGPCRGWAEPCSKGWVVMNINENGVSWSWEDEDHPKKNAPTNQAAVDLWFKYEKILNAAWRRSGLFNAAFEHAVEQRYWEQMINTNKEKNQNLLHLIINKRDYWFQLSRTQHSAKILKKLAFPEDAHIITESL